MNLRGRGAPVRYIDPLDPDSETWIAVGIRRAGWYVLRRVNDVVTPDGPHETEEAAHEAALAWLRAGRPES